MTHPAKEFLRRIVADDAQKISLKQRQREEAALTASLNNESDFLRPKWEEYKPTSLVPLWDATCLSVNIAPKHNCAHPEWIQRNVESFVDTASIAVKQLLERYELASYRALVPGGDLIVLGESKTVELQIFSVWASSNGFHLSESFPGCKKNTSQIPPIWNLKTDLKRAPGYRWALYQVLRAAHNAGKPCPTARDVLDFWTNNPQPDIQVMPDGLKYNDGLGNPKEANLKAIQQAIKGLMCK